jgi:hypothetical protein
MTRQKRKASVTPIVLFIAFLEQAQRVQQFWYVIKKQPILSKKIINQIFVNDA